MTGAWWTSWNLDPLVLLGVAAAGAAYALGRRALGPRQRGPARRAAAYYGGLAALVVALVSPVDTQAGRLLSVHMVQHLLLVLVAAPLLVVARPLVPLSLAVPREARVALRRASRIPPMATAGRTLRHPAVAWLLHVTVLWAWHAPGPYQAALGNPWVHAAEHASFLGTAALFWWVALADGPHRVLARGADVLFVLAAWMQSGALGALFTFASSPIYPAYAAAARAAGIQPLHDQQIAGLIMWVPAGLVYLAAATLMAMRWLQGIERHGQPFEPEPRLAAVDAGGPSP